MGPLPTVPEWVTLEHEVAQLLTQQEINGWYFDEEAGVRLEGAKRRELEELGRAIRDRHPYVAGAEFVPRRNNKNAGYVAECPSVRLKELNPSSRDHIAWVMSTFYGWTPTQFTDKGKATIDEVVLRDIGTEIALKFLRILELTKQLGMLSEGVNAWLKLVRNNRIHHHCSVATNTFRCAHRKPNLAQVIADDDFRSLFKASPGLTMVGADLSGIELRMLAHYLGRYDSGRYAEILLNGDIHQVNADKIGISRKQVKTVTYAFLYGAGDVKIGKSFDSSLSDKKAKAKGSEIRKAYVSAIDGLGDLLAAVKSAGDRGFVKAIDQRKILVDSSHKALNYLLQGSAAVLAKRWMLINQQTIEQTKLCCSQLAFVHDELQFECDPEHAKDLSTSLVYSAAAAGEFYNLRIPIAAESKIGKNWSEVH